MAPSFLPRRLCRPTCRAHLAADDPEHQARLAAFAQELQHLGWAVGHNLRIDTRSGASDDNRRRRDAAELVALAPDVILATGGSRCRSPAVCQSCSRRPLIR
jgi:hypothetical protein